MTTSTEPGHAKPIGGFAFIGTPLDLGTTLPFKITDRLCVAAPTTHQRAKIKRFLKEIGGHYDTYAPFECDIERREEHTPGGPPIVGYKSHRLHHSKWRYYIVKFRRCTLSSQLECEEVELLHAATKLTSTPLRIGPMFLRWGRAGNFTSDFEYFTTIAPSGGERIHLGASGLEEIRRVYNSMGARRADHPSILRSIRLYHELPDRAGYNDLNVLGLFSVLESLLTHNPRGEHDSISHQIRKKTALLEKRLPHGIEYACFGASRPDTIWSKLYELRSRIAHGGEVEFGGSLAVLKDSFTVELFIHQVLRLLLRAALEEPDLYADLKEV